MSAKEKIDLLLAKEDQNRKKATLIEADIPGFRTDVAIGQAETQAVMQLMVAAGVCTEQEYVDTVTTNLQSMINELADTGLLDPIAVEGMDFESEEETHV